MPILRSLEIETLKVPLGFIKILEIAFILIGLTALAGFRFETVATCTDGKNITRQENEVYFHFGDTEFKQCNGSTVKLFSTNFVWTPLFYKFVCFSSMSYCVLMLVIYLYRYDFYTGDDRVPRADMVATMSMAILWFLTFWSWWRSTVQIEQMTSHESVGHANVAKKYCVEDDKCTFQSYSMYATLDVSVLAALGCLILFSYNIWIVYKETSWFRDKQMSQQPHTLGDG